MHSLLWLSASSRSPHKHRVKLCSEELYARENCCLSQQHPSFLDEGSCVSISNTQALATLDITAFRSSPPIPSAVTIHPFGGHAFTHIKWQKRPSKHQSTKLKPLISNSWSGKTLEKALLAAWIFTGFWLATTTKFERTCAWEANLDGPCKCGQNFAVLAAIFEKCTTQDSYGAKLK